MTRNIEIIAFVYKNPGCISRDIADYFGITMNHVSTLLLRSKTYGLVRRDYSPNQVSHSWRYFITKWGAKYLTDKGMVSGDGQVSGLTGKEKVTEIEYKQKDIMYEGEVKKRLVSLYKKNGELSFIDKVWAEFSGSYDDVVIFAYNSAGEGFYSLQYDGRLLVSLGYVDERRYVKACEMLGIEY